MAEVISYLASASCIGGMSWVVVGTIAVARRRRMNRHLERGIAEYLLQKSAVRS
jgi:hypothetical protein